VPTVDDVIEARDASRYAHFPPQGRRSQGGSQVWNNFLNPGETYRNSINDNVLTVVMIETTEGVDAAYEIASTPGLDVVILGNSDLTSFSGHAQTSDPYQDLLTRVRDATYKAGKYWGNAGFQFATGNRLSSDSRFHQNGPSNDGWVPPARGTMVQPAAQ
jgi:2-keto-3-deoxy-L-rhamnonate aldolase RhmA